MKQRVVIDANVFVTILVLDLLMRHAELGHFSPLWSQKIIHEADDALTKRLKKPWPRVKVDHLFSTANKAFRTATIEGYEHLESDPHVEEGDRHVLAAAIHGSANLILTYNLKDFPEQALLGHGLRAIHPDDFLANLRVDNADSQADLVKEMAKSRNITNEEFLARLARSCPNSALDLSKIC